MSAFPEFSKINSMEDVIKKHRAWLKQYEGLAYSRAVHEKHMDKWQSEPKLYSDSMFDVSINCIKERKDRLKIEFDADTPEQESLIPGYIKQVQDRIKSLGGGFIESTHKGKSNYTWIEFTRDLTDKEKKAFLMWIAPSGSRIDLNFSSSQKIFQVLYAVHWRHSYQREMPIHFEPGNKIDYDTLGIVPEQLNGSISKKKTKDGFMYETFDQRSYNKQFLEELPQDIKPLSLCDIQYFKQLKKDREQIIHGFLGKEELVMLFSPPKKMKSLISLYAGFSVASGKMFLDRKTKRYPVLLIDCENNEQIKKDRIQKIAHGLKIHKNIPLFYLARGESVDVFSPQFLQRIAKTIKDKNIKVIILDTFRRMSPIIKENSSDDISKFHSLFFVPLRDNYGISCIILHHTDRKEKDYRGSSDIGGMVDSSFMVIKQSDSKNNIPFLIKPTLSRSGNVEDMLGVVNFTDNSITFDSRLVDEVRVARSEELKKITQHIRDFMKSLGPGNPVKRTVICAWLIDKEVDVRKQRSTITRSLDFLRASGFIDMSKKGEYILT